MKSAATLLLCKRLVNGRAGQWATENSEFHGKEDALGVQEGCGMCL